VRLAGEADRVDCAIHHGRAWSIAQSTCPRCYVARGEDNDQVIGVIRGHMASDHPAILASVTQQDLLSWTVAE
jgi:hypothetical protein